MGHTALEDLWIKSYGENKCDDAAAATLRPPSSRAQQFPARDGSTPARDGSTPARDGARDPSLPHCFVALLCYTLHQANEGWCARSLAASALLMLLHASSGQRGMARQDPSLPYFAAYYPLVRPTCSCSGFIATSSFHRPIIDDFFFYFLIYFFILF